jgi:hypothetical protein
MPPFSGPDWLPHVTPVSACDRLFACPSPSSQALGVKPKAPKQLKQAQLDRQDMDRLLKGTGEAAAHSQDSPAINRAPSLLGVPRRSQG